MYSKAGSGGVLLTAAWNLSTEGEISCSRERVSVGEQSQAVNTGEQEAAVANFPTHWPLIHST